MGADVLHPQSPARILLVLDQAVRAEVIRLAVIDLDLAEGAILEQLGYTAPQADRLPVIALTRRGDLKTTLAAFERGVDDILSVPFCPEELLARILAVMRRTYGAAVAFTPVLRLGELE